MYAGPPPSGPDDSSAASQKLPPRLYEVWRGNNIFVLQGRLVFGPDVRSLFLTVSLIVAPMSIFCVFVARKLMDDFSNKAGLSIMVFAVALTLIDLTFLLLTCGRDPGIVPRNSRPPEPEGHDGIIGGSNRLPRSRTREVRYGDKVIKVKYCDTCMLYRPPRCSHCSICNNCVENFDHHCPWVGQCIGLRNYRFFFMFIISTTLLCIYVFSFCWVYIVRIKNTEHKTIWRAMIKTPASIALILYTLLPFIFVAGLSIFHTYLISTNQTTYENFRYQYDRRDNPYNKGVSENFKEKFLTSIPPSKNNFRARVQLQQVSRDGVLGARFISPNMERNGTEFDHGRKASGTSSDLTVEDLEKSIANGALETKEGGSGNPDPV